MKTSNDLSSCNLSCGVHQQPAEDMECLICLEDITTENYVEYKTVANSRWYPAKFCKTCLEELQRTKFHQYVHSLKTTKCAREHRALLDRGPPVNLYDKYGFPEAESNEIHSLWYAFDNIQHSAKLDGSLEGEARITFWEEQKKFLMTHDEISDESE